MLSKPHAFIGIDNTIVDFTNTFCKIYKNYNIPVFKLWLHDSFYKNIYYNNIEDLVNNVVLYINYNLNPFDGVPEFTHKLNAMNVKVFFITRRSAKKDIIYSTYYFMKKFKIYFDKIIFCKNKIEYLNENTILFIEGASDILINLALSGRIQKEKIYKVYWDWNKYIEVNKVDFVGFNVEETIKKFLAYD